jgi:hypothetical protein
MTNKHRKDIKIMGVIIGTATRMDCLEAMQYMFSEVKLNKLGKNY